MKKKIRIGVLVGLTAGLAVIGLAGCSFVGDSNGGNAGGNNGNEAHRHESANYEIDEESHWKICDDCGETFEKGKHAFRNDACRVCGNFTRFTEGLEYELNEKTVTYTVRGIGTATDTDVIIPAYYNGKAVTSIGDSAFCACRGLTSITIPDSVTSIKGEAFYDCSGLTSVTMPNSVTSIGSRAFLRTALYNDEANWTDGVLYIGNHLIGAKETLSGSYTIKSGTKTIAVGAFQDCSKLTSVAIPDGVTSIGDKAFSYCTGLTSITIPDSVTSIGDKAFTGCGGLTSITIPDGVVTSIGDYAFYDCSGLTSITIPDSVTTIGDCAFYNCSGLTNIYYSGSRAEWNAIVKGGDWNLYMPAYTVHCSDGEI